jgi:hypothetical protein
MLVGGAQLVESRLDVPRFREHESAVLDQLVQTRERRIVEPLFDDRVPTSLGTCI